MLFTNLSEVIKFKAEESGFSGAVAAFYKDKETYKDAFGYRQREDQLPNTTDTRFGIASGCKLFTAIAVCQLVDHGLLTFNSKLTECLDTAEFPYWDRGITVHHLLTHSSGISDYFDEDIMENFEDLWIGQPMYSLRRLADFLPLFQQQPMKFPPGERFHYNNAGYILLGLIVEKLSGMEFAAYVEQHIFGPAGMKSSGYFSLDRLPPNTACGYIDEKDGAWRRNIYSLPVKGGSDGGAFVSAPDMLLCWEALLGYHLLSPELTSLLLTPHIGEDRDNYYGYGVWISMNDGDIFKYHLMGSDPGVSFRSAFYPQTRAAVAMVCNASRGAYTLLKAFEEHLPY
ncbi:serine hydrolase domain-containing protein [Paenibacillus sp. sgz500958]|uniref:serine hydrolase domain-containing protein n=1 Tax=Paenibacillus sp. sgz500958 TaxID=3242475 RepID=UPI0036D286F9